MSAAPGALSGAPSKARQRFVEAKIHISIHQPISLSFYDCAYIQALHLTRALLSACTSRCARLEVILRDFARPRDEAYVTGRSAHCLARPARGRFLVSFPEIST